MIRSVPRTDDDDGAVAVITAVSLLAMIMAAALVIDLGLVRVDARRSQSGADAAVTAGAFPLGTGEYAKACQQAWRYFTATVDGTAAPDNPACDTHFGSSFAPCEDRAASSAPPSSSTSNPGPVVMEAPYGDYVLRVQMPVRHTSDPSGATDDLLAGQAYDVDFDGSTACRRMGIQVLRDRTHILGGVSGIAIGTSNVDAVARVVVDEGEPEFATLVLLEQNRCPTLTTDGQGSVVIQNAYADPLDPTSDLEAAGIIHIDSAATTSCGGGSGNGRLVHPGNSANSAICSGVDSRPAGTIDSIILDADCGTVLPDTLRTKGNSNLALSQFLAGGTNDEQLEANPLSVGDRLTRALVDHRYNCLTAGYPTNEPQYPRAGLSEPNESCTSATRGPHVDQLIDATITGTPPPGFTSYNDCGSTAPVRIQFVYVNCAALPLATFQSDVVVLKGGNRTQDGLRVATGQTASISPYVDGGGDEPTGSSILVVRDGNVTVQGGGSLALIDTFVYLHDGDVRVTGGEGVDWLAPDEEGYDDDTEIATGCESMKDADPLAPDVPDPSCFQHLALWSNASAAHSFAGTGTVDVRGVFFTPNAHFTLSGSGNAGSDSPLKLEDAQFFTNTLGISGGAGVVMKPNRDVFIETPSYSVVLTR